MKRNLLKIVAILMIGLLVACSNDTEDETTQNKVVPVETTKAKKDELVVHKTLLGRTAPNNMTPIMAQLPGEIDTLEVENGDHVDEDDLIATLKTQAGIQNIKASETGEIVELKLKEGDMATESEPLAMIIDMEQMKVNYTVTNNVRTLLEKDMKLETTIGGNSYDVEIISIGMIPDETGLYPVEAIVENKNNELIPGLVVKTSIPEKRIKEAIILPTEAIIEDSDGAYVYIVEDDKVIKTEVTIKESQSDVTAIEGEVSGGDEVVINGQLTLSDGSKVEVVKAGNES